MDASTGVAASVALPIGEARAEDDVLISAAGLHARVFAIFRALGSEAREAALIADHLVLANLFGHDSHGVSLIPLYVRMVREGKVATNRRVRIVLDHPAILTLDAERGFGQATAKEAMDLAIPRALAHGVAVVALRNSHHIGRIGHWAEQCARSRLVSVHFVNILGSPAVVAPFAGADARLHTNPVAIGLPRDGEEPIVLDFATSRAAQGKMRIAMNRGIAVPEGYLIDAGGRPSTDPSVVYRHPLGALLSFGEHKGSGLGVMCDLLAGALSGAGTLHEGTIEEGIYLNNMLSILIDPEKLAGHETWQREVAAGIQFIRASPSRGTGQGVMLPGEPERRTREQRESNGIPVDRMTWALLSEAAASVGMQLHLP